MSDINTLLKEEISRNERNSGIRRTILKCQGFKKYISSSHTISRAMTFSRLIMGYDKHIYMYDLIAGSIKGIFSDSQDPKQFEAANDFMKTIGERTFWTNYDHAAPNYQKLLSNGVDGILQEVSDSSSSIDSEDPKYDYKHQFLESIRISVQAFSKMIHQYAAKADRMLKTEADEGIKDRLAAISIVCHRISHKPPQTFHEALQLVWFTHLAFVLEGRYAMAFGRMDQYLYPYFIKDLNERRITLNSARELLENVFLKIGELSTFCGHDDVVNICIGGLKTDGTDGTNELSYLMLEAVKNCSIPGPNLSARFHKGTDEKFYIKCLEVIKTGIGYPALFNDEVIVPSLMKKGYPIEDARNYCLVGCIETFIQGKQPPWSDGRFNTPKYIELALNDGCCMMTNKRIGIRTGDPLEFDTFDKFLDAFRKQVEYGAEEYVRTFNEVNSSIDSNNFTSPFLSALFDDCIMNARDINDGGTVYPSNHGAACMGIGTVTDSLSAIYELVYNRKLIPMETLVKALKADYKGYEYIQAMFINNILKYGNNIDSADRFAVFYVELLSEIFNRYKTPDGGHFLILMAANTANVFAGKETAATPDGRNACMPLSDAASPTYGMDRKGPTAVINSVTKPDYKLVTGGTVVNQKFHPSMFKDEESIKNITALLKTYFEKGGQEMQINVISRQTLVDAMNNPEHYRNLIVRVSGFSAYFVTLDVTIKRDIISRTEHTVDSLIN